MVRKALQGSGNGNGNLKPWPKGVSGNPAGGKPKALTIAKIWRDLVEAPDPDDEERRARVVVLGLKLYEMGKQGNTPAAKLLLDRSYGTSMIEALPEENEGVEAEIFYGWIREDKARFAAYVSHLRKVKGNGAK